MPDKLLPSISLLPEHIIDQIKAGEVIERTASLLKEILENSIDAGSRNIDLKIVNNGLDLIILKDDGLGMSFDQLPFAFCRHATSKLNSFEQLYTLNSFGFRGEALASISSISKVKCSSSPIGKEPAGQIEINGSQTISHIKIAKNEYHGTTLVIKDLFYNTPVRLKFVKSFQAEKNSIKRMINSFVISNPTVGFTINIDDKITKYSQALDEESFLKRILKIVGKRKSLKTSELTLIENEWEGNTIRAIVPPNNDGFSSREQYLFVNNRLFTDRSIHQLLHRSLPIIWEKESGPYILFIDVPPNEIDVNVHPAKTMIKFFKLSSIMGLIKGSIENEIKKRQINTNIESPQKHQQNFLNENNNIPLKDNSLQQIGNQSIQTELQINKTFTILNRDIILHQYNNKDYITSIKKIFEMTINEISKNSPIDESLTTPLLIASIAQTKKKVTQKEFDSLKEMGLELEKIGNNQLVLRTIPDQLRIFPSKVLLNAIIALRIDSDFNQFYFDLTENEIDSIIKEINLDLSIMIGATRLINNDTFESIFK